jgi:hypothetical protein
MNLLGGCLLLFFVFVDVHFDALDAYSKRVGVLASEDVIFEPDMNVLDFELDPAKEVGAHSDQGCHQRRWRDVRILLRGRWLLRIFGLFLLFRLFPGFPLFLGFLPLLVEFFYLFRSFGFLICSLLISLQPVELVCHLFEVDFVVFVDVWFAIRVFGVKLLVALPVVFCQLFDASAQDNIDVAHFEEKGV